MSFDKLFDLTAGVYFNFYIIYYTRMYRLHMFILKIECK